MRLRSFKLFRGVIIHLAHLTVLARAVVHEANFPNTTYSGYLNVNRHDGSKMFYTYYETQHTQEDTPILLWLQGGPGCAGQFGNFYELGPQWVSSDLKLVQNKGAWNRHAGLLFLDQPIGVGFSVSGKGKIPDNEDEIAEDLYIALQQFFLQHEALQGRQLFITGESYAGKYIPAIGDYILRKAAQYRDQEKLSADTEGSGRGLNLEKPSFMLAGLAIGNGLTDPATQVKRAASTLFFSGLIDQQQREAAEGIQDQVAQAIKSITGVGTLLDYRRTEDYDSHHLVDRYLNQQHVKDYLGVDGDLNFTSCSEEVDSVLQVDVMRSVAYLIPSILEKVPILLYQGAFDAQDGPAGQEAWIQDIRWHGREEFIKSPRHIWRASESGSVDDYHQSSQKKGLPQVHNRGRILGYWKEYDTLTHLVIKNAGHMVPRDDPLAAQEILLGILQRVRQAMIESWVEHVLSFHSQAVA